MLLGTIEGVQTDPLQPRLDHRPSATGHCCLVSRAPVRAPKRDGQTRSDVGALSWGPHWAGGIAALCVEPVRCKGLGLALLLNGCANHLVYDEL